MQAIAVVISGFALAAVLNLGVVLLLCGWAVWASVKGNIKQMSHSSFWLFITWLWSGMARFIITAPDPSQLLWMPMLIVAVVMAVVYINLSHQKKTGNDG